MIDPIAVALAVVSLVCVLSACVIAVVLLARPVLEDRRERRAEERPAPRSSGDEEWAPSRGPDWP